LSHWRPSIPQWAEFLAALTASLQAAGHAAPHQPGIDFSFFLMRGDLGGDLGDRAIQRLPAAMLPQLRMVVGLIRGAETITRHTVGSDAQRQELRAAREQLAALVHYLDQSEGRRSSRFPGIIRNRKPKPDESGTPDDRY
jgi:hypothetical protein